MVIQKIRRSDVMQFVDQWNSTISLINVNHNDSLDSIISSYTRISYREAYQERAQEDPQFELRNFRSIRRRLMYIRGKTKKETELSGILVDETKEETVNPPYNFAEATTERMQHKLGHETGHGASCEINPLPTVVIFQSSLLCQSHG